jgi:hypothetical protein
MSTVDSLDLKRAREYIDIRDNNTCCHCNLDFTKDETVKKNIDHIIPRSTLAWSHPFNLQLLCETCNKNKGSDILSYTNDLIQKSVEKTTKMSLYGTKVPDSIAELNDFMQNKAYTEKMDALDALIINFMDVYDVLSIHYDDDFINNELIQVSLYSEENNEIIDGIWSIFEKELDSIFEPYTKKHLDLIVNGSIVEMNRYAHKLGKFYLKIADRLRKIGLIEYYEKYSRVGNKFLYTDMY